MNHGQVIVEQPLAEPGSAKNTFHKPNITISTKLIAAYLLHTCYGNLGLFNKCSAVQCSAVHLAECSIPKLPHDLPELLRVHLVLGGREN